MIVRALLMVTCLSLASGLHAQSSATRYASTFDVKPTQAMSDTKPGVGRSLLRGYKRFVSSQYISRCQFSPTCSEYAVVSVQRNGLVVGTLAAFDRLSRCHAFSRKQYRHDGEGRLIDPVE